MTATPKTVSAERMLRDINVPTWTPALPKNLASAADELYTLRAARYALQKVTKLIEERESALREHLIDNLDSKNSTGVAGRVARASVELKDIYVLDTEKHSWDSVYKYLLKNAPKDPGVWALMERRLSGSTAKDMIENGARLPFIKKMTVKSISSTKISA